MTLDRLHRVDDPSAQTHDPRSAGPGASSSRPLLFSYQIGADRRKSDNEIRYGYAHYTYAVVAKRFVQLLKELHLNPVEVLRPEIHPSAPALAGVVGNERPVHLIFKPAEHIRVMRHAYNIGLVAWEFDKITQAAVDKAPFSNQLRMLQLLDELWVASEHTKAVFARAGLGNIHVIPCPVPVPPSLPGARPDAGFLAGVDALRLNFKPGRGAIERSEIADAEQLLRQHDRGSAKIFLSILNPHDWRKDIGCMIESFCALLKKDPRHVLLIKCVVDDVHFSINNLYDMIHYRFAGESELVSDNVVFISKRLSDEQMTALYEYADFYFCTSRAEGQCLPLIEAMAHGCVPVSTSNTAMSDYIDPTTALVLETFRTRVNPLATEFGKTDFFWHQATLDGCVRQLEAATRLGEAEYGALRAQARDKAEALFSPQSVGRRIKARLARL